MIIDDEKKPAEISPELPPQPQKPAESQTSTEQVKTPEKKKGPLNWVFNKETKLGRANRAIVRSLGWLVGLFAIGFLTAFLLLYSPLNQKYNQLAATYLASETQLKAVQAELQTLKNENSQVQVSLEKQKMLNATYVFNEQVIEVQMALQQHDSQGAVYSFKKLQKGFETYSPVVEKLDISLAKSMQNRLAVIDSELASDAKTAQLDLEALIKNLQDIKAKLAQ